MNAVTRPVSFLACAVLSFSAIARAQTNWPRFGGAAGDFTAHQTSVGRDWSKESIAWRVELGGVGQSSPTIWGERIFVTTSEKLSSGKVFRMVLCINRADGKTLWRQQAATGPGEDLHNMNTWATPSCATDGELVVAYFGPGGLHCYTVDGEHQWSLDPIDASGAWGFAGSPIVVGDLVVQNCDGEGDSFLMAVNKKSGKEVWRTKRRDTPKGGWSTPVLIDTGKRQELVLNGEFGVQAYDPETGEDLWYCKSFNGRGTPMPAWTGKVLVTVNGKPGDIYAVTPGGAGDVTDSHMAWHTPRGGGRDIPSPVVVGDYVFTVNMSGIATMYDAASGKVMWKERLDGKFTATPIVAGTLVYALDEAGTTHVILAGDKLHVVAKNSITAPVEEIFRASPTPSGGQVFFRSDRALYCVGSQGAE